MSTTIKMSESSLLLCFDESLQTWFSWWKVSITDFTSSLSPAEGLGSLERKIASLPIHQIFWVFNTMLHCLINRNVSPHPTLNINGGESMNFSKVDIWKQLSWFLNHAVVSKEQSPDCLGLWVILLTQFWIWNKQLPTIDNFAIILKSKIGKAHKFIKHSFYKNNYLLTTSGDKFQ